MINKTNLKNFFTPTGIFVFLFFFTGFLYNYNHTFFYPPRSIHQWRQADCLSFALNYYQDGMKFFEPTLNSILGCDGNETSKGIVEFPGIYYFVAALWKVFGKHEFIYRFVLLAFVFCGLFALFKFSSEALKSKVWGLFTPFFIFSSPIFAFYGVSFLMDAPALCLAFCGLFFFWKFYDSQKNEYLWISMSLFLFAGLLKISALIVFAAIASLYGLELIGMWKGKNSQKIFSSPIKQLLPFLMVIIGIVSWYSYTSYMNSLDMNGYYLQGILPIWNFVSGSRFDEIIEGFNNIIFNGFFFKYFVWFMIFIIPILLIFWKKVNRFLGMLTLFTGVGFIVYIILFFGAFDVHDYYFINLLIFPAVLLITFFHFLKFNVPSWNFAWKETILFLFLGLNIYHCAAKHRMRYEPISNSSPFRWLLRTYEVKFWDNFHAVYKDRSEDFETIAPWLRNNGIMESDTVISIPDISPNISLYFMNLRGWTFFNGCSFYNNQGKLRELISKGAKYLFINDTMRYYNEVWLKPFLSTKIGTYGSIGVFDLSKIDNIVFIKASNNKFLSAERDEANHVLANRNHNLTWESFHLIFTDDHKLAILADDGKCVSVRLDKGNVLMHVATQIGEWEKFEMIMMNNDTFLLKACNGKFVMRNGEILSSNADNISDAEFFLLVKL